MPRKKTAAKRGSTTAARGRAAKKQKNEEKEENVEESKVDSSASSSSSSEARVLEKGHLYFFYRPKVDAVEVKGPGDVQRFYMLISPDGVQEKPRNDEELQKPTEETTETTTTTTTEEKKSEESTNTAEKGRPKHRLLLVASKTLPSPGSGRSRVWAFVDSVSADLSEVEEKLERFSYSTQTRGEREVQPARLCGEARYELIQLQSDHPTHLVYELIIPEQPTEVQKAFHIYQQGQFLVQVKNPAFETPARSDRWAGLKGDRKAEFPSHLREKFIGKRQPEVRYSILDTPEWLDVLHSELVLIGIGKDAHAEFPKIVEELETEAEEELKEAKAENPQHPEQKSYEELGMSEKEHPDAVQQFT